MIKSKIVIVTFFVLTLLNSIAFAEESPSTGVSVAVIQSGMKTEQVILSKGRVQVSAENIKYDDPTKMYELTGKSAVTIIQDASHSLRLKSDAEEKVLLQAAQVEDQIDAGGSIEVDHFAPISELNKEIQIHPFFTDYRVKWFFSVFSYHSAGVALYNRNTGTISEYIREGDWDTGGYSRTLFSGVTDKILSEMAQDVKDKNLKAGNPNQTAPFDFGNLTRYGCKAEKLK